LVLEDWDLESKELFALSILRFGLPKPESVVQVIQQGAKRFVVFLEAVEVHCPHDLFRVLSTAGSRR
jgi:hypothetical protein